MARIRGWYTSENNRIHLEMWNKVAKNIKELDNKIKELEKKLVKIEK